MNMKFSKKSVLWMTTIVILLAASCAASVDMSNPAAQFCDENGGKIEIRNGENGKYGVCVFKDGSECDEWEYARGECKPASEEEQQAGMANPASVYCEEQGGTLEVRDEEGGQIGYCMFDDGSECEEWAFYRGECAIGGANILTPSEPTSDAIKGSVFLSQVEVMIAESFPVQITLRLTGEMPTPCDQLEAIVKQPDSKNKIVVEFNSWQENSGLACTQVMTPFISTIEVPTTDLAEGTYTIWMDGEMVGGFDYPG